MHKRQRARWPWLAAFASIAVVLTGSIATGAAGKTSQQGVCATIGKYSVQKQTNAHAALILAACGRTPASAEALNSSFNSLARLRSQPQDYGGTDVDIITGGEGTSPHVVQSETQVWAAGNTVVSTYNDSRTAASSCFSGGSYSTNGGSTWTNLNSRPVLYGSRRLVRRSHDRVRRVARQVDRLVPRRRMRRPGPRHLDVERRRNLGDRPLRSQRERRRP